MIVPVYTGGLGLNNKVPRYRLPYDPETGVSAFSNAENVLVSQTGEVASARGPQQAVGGVFHSGYEIPGGSYIVEDRQTDSAILLMDEEANLVGVRSGLTLGQKMAYCDSGQGILYSNGYENGILRGQVSTDWPESKWPKDDTRTTWASIPPTKVLSFLSGRVVFALGNELKYSEYGLIGLYDEATNGEVFEEDIVAIAPVADGLYVSDTSSVYFLQGLDPKKWQRTKVLNFPALPFGISQQEYLASDLGYETSVLVRLMATARGPVTLFPSGQVSATITNVLDMADCAGNGAITVVNESIILQTGE